MASRVSCGNCNKELDYKLNVCPYCGSTLRTYKHWAQVIVGITPSTGLKLKDSTGFLKRMMWSKNKTSGKTKRPAKEALDIDHTDEKETVKRHIVTEIDEFGNEILVHDETIISPAKRRMNINNTS